MKKTFSLILALVLALSMFVSCGEGGNDIQAGIDEIISSENLEDAVKKFMQFLAEGEYLKASECYTNEVYGNYELETQASDAIIEYCEGINTKVLSGEYTEKDAKNKLGVVDKVIDNASISIPDYNAIASKVNASVASKAAYLAGVELEKLENYSDAIKEYGKVIGEDTNYTDARSAIDRCTDLIKKDAYEKADKYIADKNYPAALDELNEILAVLPNDSEVLSKISVYEKTYIKSVIEDAYAAFATVDKYEDALKIISSGLQYYPDNSELLAKKDYYNSFVPVKITTFKEYDRHNLKISATSSDALGNVHTDVMEKNDIYFSDGGGSVVYVLDGTYNKLKFTVYGIDPGRNYLTDVSVRDYSKGNYDESTYIYLNETIKCTALPFEVEIDITGVKMVRLFCGEGVAIADAKVYKTVK